jgi:hypothetical protein
MPSFGSPLLSTLLALAATFLALSIVVQIVQEIYKYLTKSKSRAYENALVDFLGPWASQLFRPGVLFNLQARGPFQFKRLSPRGALLPMDRDDLLRALERTCSPWVKRATDAIQMECQLQQDGSVGASTNWKRFLGELGKVEKAEAGYWDAYEVAKLLADWGHDWKESAAADEAGRIGELSVTKSAGESEAFDAAKVRVALRRRFMEHIDKAGTDFPQFERNVTYAYQRRNLRQTFVLAFLLALAFDLAFDKLYTKASAVTPEKAVAMATQATSGAVGLDYLVNWSDVGQIWNDGLLAIIRHLFSCLVTALLLSFGAPFWNDLASSLLQFQRSRKSGAS